jgi:hypothetical protein
MLRIMSLILLSFVFKSVLACGGPDHVRPLDVIAENANDLLHKREFKALDKLAEEYRGKNSLASDGQPKLMGFYAGVLKSASGCGGPQESEEQWNDHKLLLLDWSKNSTLAGVPNLALAMFEAAFGWHARGSGFASTVSEEGWTRFRQRTANARMMLEKLGPEARKDPQWYEAMLRIGLAQGWKNKEFDALYQEAINRFPYYYAYYFTKGSFYSAKWHGSQDEFKAFVDGSVNATAPKLGETMYARLNWSASSNSMFTDGQTDWNRMKRGFEKLIEDFPDSWNRNNFAKFACMAGDKKTLREQLALIGDRVALGAWGSMSYFQACVKYGDDGGGRKSWQKVSPEKSR